MNEKIGLIVLCLLVLMMAPSKSFAVEKHALIIANKDYLHGGALTNPIKDSKILARTLREAGFNVKVKENLTLDGMRKAISDFGWEHSETDDVAMIYYSGHGAEFNGENYLIPIDAKLEDARRARSEALTLSDVQNFMYRDISDEERSKGKNAKGLNIIVLDACRNNPYPARKKSATRGLGEVEGASGTLIWYAAQPGAQADDGDGSDISPFAGAFAKAIDESAGETVEETFKQVATLTLKSTSGQQEPWMAGNILGRFSFKPGNSTSNQRILAKFDPAQLDRKVPLFAPDNPSENVIKKFDSWNYGTFAKMGNQPFKNNSSQPWDYEVAQIFKALNNKGPVLNAFAEKPAVWRKLGGKMLSGFIYVPGLNDVIFHPFVDDMSAVFITKPLDSDLYLKITFHKSDGFVKSIGKNFDKFQLTCHEYFCGGNSNYQFAPRWPRLSYDDINSGLENVSFIRMEILNYQEMGIRPESAVHEIPTRGLKDALKYMIDDAKQKQKPIANSRKPAADIFADILNSSGVTKAFEKKCGRYFFRYEVYAFVKGLYGCYSEAVHYKFTKEFGSDFAESFNTLFELTNRAIGDKKLCPDRHCIDAQGVTDHLNGLARAYIYNFSKMSDVPIPIRKAIKSASNLTKSYKGLKNSAITEEDRYRLTNAESYYQDKLSRFRDLAIFKIYEFRNFFNQYTGQFPLGNGPLKYNKIKSIVDGLTFKGSSYFGQKIKEKLHRYLKVSRQHAHTELEQDAWSQCSKEAGFSVLGAKQCYHEFGKYFPTSSRLDEAKKIVTEIETKKVCGAADKAWSFISLGNNVTVLNAFIAEYPHCESANLAKRRLKTLQ